MITRAAYPFERFPKERVAKELVSKERFESVGPFLRGSFGRGFK